jgi:hypothetical protein
MENGEPGSWKSPVGLGKNFSSFSESVVGSESARS